MGPDTTTQLVKILVTDNRADTKEKVCGSELCSIFKSLQFYKVAGVFFLAYTLVFCFKLLFL